MNILKIALFTVALTGFNVAHAALVGFYDFNDGTTNDTSGAGNNPVNVGSGISLVPNGGPLGDTAASFDNSASGFIDLPININPSNAVTMGAWIKPSSSGTNFGKILSHDNGGFDRTIGFDFRGGPGVGIGMFNGSGVVGSIPVAFGDWHFVAVRYNGATASLTVNDVTVTAADNTLAGFSTLRIGGNPGFSEFYDGLMDNVFIFDEFLSDAELTAFRNSVVPLPGALPLIATAFAAFNLMARRRRLTNI